MKTKRIIAIALILMFALSLAACGGGDTSPGGNTTNSPVTTPGATPSGNDDPCHCCPNCNQEECECAECGNSEDCECELPGSGIYTITAEGTYKHIENEYAKFDFILTFSATNDGDGLYGDYTGSGELRLAHDEADYLAAMGGQMTAAKLVVDGQLNNIRFTLEKPQPGDDPNIIARGSGEMVWDNTVVESLFVAKGGESMPWPWNGASSEQFAIEIEILDSGAGVLYITPGFFATLSYEVRLTEQ